MTKKKKVKIRSREKSCGESWISEVRKSMNPLQNNLELLLMCCNQSSVFFYPTYSSIIRFPMMFQLQENIRDIENPILKASCDHIYIWLANIID